MTRRSLGIALLLLIVAAVSSAQNADDFSIPSSTTAALGGPHRAWADGFPVLFTNPAGLLDLEPRFSYSELTVSASGPIFSIAGIVAQGLGGGDLGTLLASPSVQSLLSGIDARFSITGPVSFGYVGAGMGFGIFNDTQLLVVSRGVSSLELRLGERFVLRGGYALDVPLPESLNSRLGVGVGLKGFVRGDAVVSTTLLTLPSLFESLGPDLLIDAPFELISGIGIDAGIRFVWSDLVAGALTVDNLYSPSAVVEYSSVSGFADGTASAGATEYDTYPQEINFGLAYTPGLEFLDRYVQDVTVLFDYSDIFDFWITPEETENIVLKMGLGLEATFLEVLSLRGGFHEGLFAAGLGVDMTYVRLNAAVFGSELSSEPGLRPVYNLIIGLEFRG